MTALAIVGGSLAVVTTLAALVRIARAVWYWVTVEQFVKGAK